jgi:hypothetical protein
VGWVRVVDADSGGPIEGALVTTAAGVARTDGDGALALPRPAWVLALRAPGYRRMEWSDPGSGLNRIVVHLRPFRPKALYLSFHGIGDAGLRGAALKLVEQTELNALVIDVKGDRGGVPYRSEVALAAAQKVRTVRDMFGLLEELRERGIYTIARVVAFKDDPLVRARPELAVRTGKGGIYRDWEGLAWSDPFRSEVRDYVIGIAEEAARLGFDEIQFDYLRFPDAKGLVFSKPDTEPNRVAAIHAFLAEARRRLAPYNVFLAADVFGYVLWNRDDTDIGQRLEDLTPLVDIISPMLYPSCFQFGIPGYREAVAHPYEIVDLTLRHASNRAGLPARRFRPWLQAFRDYAFDRRVFGAKEIGDQIRAAEAFGANGWMLWNPRNVYGEAGLRKK